MRKLRAFLRFAVILPSGLYHISCLHGMLRWVDLADWPHNWPSCWPYWGQYTEQSPILLQMLHQAETGRVSWSYNIGHRKKWKIKIYFGYLYRFIDKWFLGLPINSAFIFCHLLYICWFARLKPKIEAKMNKYTHVQAHMYI